MPQIDLDFRPVSYWEDASPLAAVLQRIKGTMRRAMVRDFIEGRAPAALGDIDAALLEESLDAETRERLVSFNRHWSAGEYLPDQRPGDVELVRFELNSSMGDVISLRASRSEVGGPITYYAVDEYPDDHNYVVTPESSPSTLTMRELVAMIDGIVCPEQAECVEPFVETMVSVGADGDIDFIRVVSDLYPELERYYRERLERWAAPEDEEDECEE
jgi:hypothetical protein